MFVPYGRLQRRVQKLEQPHQTIKIVEVILRGQDEPDPPHAPGVEVIEIRLDDPAGRGGWEIISPTAIINGH
jgi:hypothetical protein